MVQAFVEADPEVDVVAMVVEDDPRLRRMAVFDAVMNNTDRKGGHILPVDGGRHVYGVDHGVTLLAGAEAADRAVGLARPAARGGRARRARADPRRRSTASSAWRSRGLLSRAEVRATARRADALLASGRFPYPSPDWPAIPWPPF